MRKPALPLEQRGAVSYREAADYLGIGVTAVKRMVADGELRVAEFGRRRPIPMADVLAALRRRLGEAA